MASTSPVVSQSLKKELHRRYSNREIKTKRVLQIWIAKKTNPMNPGRAVTWEEKGETWYTWVTQMFHFLQALLCFGKVLKIPSFFFFIFLFFFLLSFSFFFLFNNNRTCVSKKSLPHRCEKSNATTSLSQLCHTPCFKVGYWLSAQVFLQGTLKNLWGEECFASPSWFYLLSSPILLFICILLAPKFTGQSQLAAAKEALGPMQAFLTSGLLSHHCCRRTFPNYILLPHRHPRATDMACHDMGRFGSGGQAQGAAHVAINLFVSSWGDWTTNKCI